MSTSSTLLARAIARSVPSDRCQCREIKLTFAAVTGAIAAATFLTLETNIRLGSRVELAMHRSPFSS